MKKALFFLVLAGGLGALAIQQGCSPQDLMDIFEQVRQNMPVDRVDEFSDLF